MSTSSRLRLRRPLLALAPLVAALWGAPGCAPPDPSTLPADDSITLSTQTLRDKIKGAWAAQTIGVTYGYPVEFRFNSERVPDERELP